MTKRSSPELSLEFNNRFWCNNPHSIRCNVSYLLKSKNLKKESNRVVGAKQNNFLQFTCNALEYPHVYEPIMTVQTRFDIELVCLLQSVPLVSIWENHLYIFLVPISDDTVLRYLCFNSRLKLNDKIKIFILIKCTSQW